MALALRCPHCSKAAFYFKNKPTVGYPLYATDVYVADGVATPTNGAAITCQYCARGIALGALHDINLFKVNE